MTGPAGTQAPGHGITIPLFAASHVRHPSVCCLFLGALLLSTNGCGPSRVERPTKSGPLGPEEAARYVLELVNRDRAEEGLGELEWDPIAAKAAERHARDMASNGFTAHWGTDGSVPEQRYTEAGGRLLVRENAACFFDGAQRELDPNPVFEVAELEKIELEFISEVPPNDGHRRNILEPTHSRGGIGLAKPLGLKQLCMAQELVGAFGEFGDLPERASAHGSLRVTGEVFEPVRFGGVGVKRLDSPKPRSAEELNQTSSYNIPPPDVTYFPEGFKTPKPVKVDGGSFEIDVPLGPPGLYHVSVWGQFPDSKGELEMVSLRTVRVD